MARGDFANGDCKVSDFDIVEGHVLSKRGQLDTPETIDCEDAIYVSPNFIALIDGATSKTERRWHGETGGRVAARIIGETFMELPCDITARQAFDTVASAIQRFYEVQHVLDIVTTDPLQRLMASVIVLSVARREVWQVGDCQALIGQKHLTNNKMIDRIAADARAMFLETELLQGRSIAQLRQHDSGRDFILPLLERQSLFQNNDAAGPYRYGVVDGFPIADDEIHIHPLPEDVDTIVLASDGYPHLKSTLAASERALETIIRDDPLLFRQYKSTKGVTEGNASFDDRSYMKVRLKPGANRA